MKRKKIIMGFILCGILLKNPVYAKYVYYLEDTIINLSRDANSPVCQVSYSTQEWTNQNVRITITANKEIEQVSGFELSEDKKVLTKEVSQNESGVLKIRDFSGNEAQVEYEVSNIDKEFPKIIGCENGGKYPKPLKLDYSDNVEIKNISVDLYSNKLRVNSENVYTDSFYYQGIDRTQNTIRVNVITHPLNTKKYKYFINNKLYATTTDTSYTFTGLNKGTNYVWKVQAIDGTGKVLDEISGNNATSYFNSLTANKTPERFVATFHNLDIAVSKVRYAVWNYYDEPNKRWYDSSIKNNRIADITCIPFHTSLYPSYVVHAYLYNAKGEVLDVVGFSIDFKSNYIPPNHTIDVYHLNKAGDYQIMVSDLAGNETIYYIQVKD